MSAKNKDTNKLYTLAEAIAHTDKTIEIAGNRLQKNSIKLTKNPLFFQQNIRNEWK